MERLKKLLGAIPSIVWIILAIILVVVIVWKIDDIGSWWEHRKQAQFDKAQVESQLKIDSLTKERDEARALWKEAEAREQLKSQEADALKLLIEQKGGKIAQDEKKLEEIAKKYQEDQALIDAAKRGEISLFDLCTKQCLDSAEIGFPCRSNYCSDLK